jgi:predicted glycoside hydrolase/deacetylase ChbG (UPF0249 family)
VSHSAEASIDERFAGTTSLSDSMTDGPQTLTPPAPGRFLIVNADDFGRNDAVNAAVAESFRRGIVTSTSIVATGPRFDQALAVAKDLPTLGIGIHLAVSEYLPALPPTKIPSLVNSGGRFHPRAHQFRRMALDPRMREDLLLEWDAQIAKVIDAGMKPTHIDGHGHCHAHPAAAGVVLKLAERYGIKNVRLPAEPIWWRPGLTLSSRFVAKLGLNLASQLSRAMWEGKLRFPKSFYGFSKGGQITRDVIREIAMTVPPGISELMVHVATSEDQLPGYHTKFDFTIDFRGVTAFAKDQFEREFGVYLVPYQP